MDDVPPFYRNEGLHTEIYDVFAEEAVGHDLAFWRACAAEYGGPILELGSGTGRVSWALADAGFEVVGLDRSEPMLRRAEAKVTDHPGARATFHLGDMSDFDLARRFGLVVVPFRAFQALLTVAAQESALACIRRHLVPGGHLVLDLFDPRLEFLVPGGRPHSVVTLPHPEHDTTVRIETADRTLDPVAQVFTETWRLTELDASGASLRQEHERLELRWLYRYETRHLLRLAGFEIVAEYSDFDRSPPAYGLEQIWVVRSAQGR